MATADRQRQYKQGINVEESRRRREDTTIQIRKTKKEDRMNQRRKMVMYLFKHVNNLHACKKENSIRQDHMKAQKS